MLVPIFLIIQMMRLVSVSESIKAGIKHLFHTGFHLFGAKSMALPQEMFIFTGSVQKHRFAVQKETPVIVVAFNRPAYGADTERSFQHIAFFLSLSDAGNQLV